MLARFNVRMFLHSLGNTSRHFRAVERLLSGRGSADQSEATEHWRSPGLFRAMRFILSRNTNGSENQVEKKLNVLRKLVSLDLVGRWVGIRAKVLGTRHKIIPKNRNVLCVVKPIHTKTVQTKTKKNQNVQMVGGPMSPIIEAVLHTRIKPLGNMWSKIKFLMPS